MIASAPSSASLAALASLEVVATTRAPSILANCSANSETPPVPCVTTTDPGPTPPWTTTADQAVRAAQGKVEPNSVEMPGGRRTSAGSEITTVCCKTPSPPGPPPSAVASLIMSGAPAIQPEKNAITTESPTLTLSQPAPVASITPAPSVHGTMGSFWRGL